MTTKTTNNITHPCLPIAIVDMEGNQTVQRPIVIWLTGLSGSGKTTIATTLENNLKKQGIRTMLLDGDVARNGLNKDLGFSDEDRTENIRRITEVAKLFLNCGIFTICAFVSPTEKIRSIVRDIVGKENLLEIYVKTPLEICEQRDVKGLYAKARAGLIPDFTGISAPFEEPQNADLVIETDKMTVEEGVKAILKMLCRAE